MNSPPTKRTWERSTPRVGRRFVLQDKTYTPELVVFTPEDKKFLASVRWSSIVVRP